MQHTEQLAPRAAATSPLTLPRSLVERMRLRSRRQHEWLRTALGEPHSRSRADAPTAHPAPPARSEPSHRPVALWLTHCPHWAETPPLALLPASRETPPLCSTRYTRSLCIAPGYKARALQDAAVLLRPTAISSRTSIVIMVSGAVPFGAAKSDERSSYHCSDCASQTATRFPNARFSAQSVAQALVLLRVRGQVERQWEQKPSHHPEGQAQRALWLQAMY